MAALIAFLCWAPGEAGACPVCGADAVSNSNVGTAYFVTVLLFSLLPILMTGLFVFWYRRRIRMPQSPLENP
ncbi:MAG: hypothetical protein QF541_02830 [Lentisphaeria bacterium]|nr:hypothetical protein [Lentisphaeria bacterium]